MAYALGIAVVWLVLFASPGLLVHRFALGRHASGDALDFALVPTTGLAVGVVVLSLLGTLHVHVGTTAVQASLVGAAVLCAIVLNRIGVSLRSVHAAWPLVVLVCAVVVMQLPVWSHPNRGPVGYGTGHDPVVQTAQVRVVAARDHASSPLDRSARELLGQQYPGFQQFAGFTVGLGGTEDSGWSAFDLTSLITALLAAFAALPIFVLARAAKLHWFGTAVAVIAASVAPPTLVAIGLGEGPGIAALPFALAAIAALVRVSDNRGRWLIAATSAAAVACIAGPLALIAPLAAAIALGALRRVAPPASSGPEPERLAPRAWPTLVAGVGAVAAATVIGAWNGLRHARGLPWDGLFGRTVHSIMSWPLVWLGTSLGPHSPVNAQEATGIVVGAVLVVVGIAAAIARRDRAELVLVVAAFVPPAVGALVALGHPALGRQLVEFGWLVGAPVLAVVCVRAVALIRTASQTAAIKRSGSANWVSMLGANLLGLAFVGLSLAATVTSGGRFTQTPPLAKLEHSNAPALAISSNRWIAYAVPIDPASLVSGDAVHDELAVPDIDAHTSNAVPLDSRADGFDVQRLFLPFDPLASDPAAAYTPAGTMLGSELWESRLLDGARIVRPLAHDPIERAASADAGGLLAPPLPTQACGKGETDATCFDGVPASGDCAQVPKAVPVATPLALQDVKLAPTSGAANRTSNAFTATNPDGVACWSVPIQHATTSFLVHVKPVGYVLQASQASPLTGAWHRTSIDGSDAWTTDQRGAKLQFSVPGLASCAVAQFEGAFAGGAQFDAEPDLHNTTTCASSGTSLNGPIDAEIPAASAPWTPFVAVPTSGRFSVEDTSGTRMTVARAVVSPSAPEPGWCDVELTAKAPSEAVVNILTSFEVQMYVPPAVKGAQPVAWFVLRTFGDENEAQGKTQADRQPPPPFEFLADWTEQYAQSAPPQTSCTS